jgi:hypothetical protein
MRASPRFRRKGTTTMTIPTIAAAAYLLLIGLPAHSSTHSVVTPIECDVSGLHQSVINPHNPLSIRWVSGRMYHDHRRHQERQRRERLDRRRGR